DLLYRIRRIVKGDAPPSRSGGITATVAAFSLVLGGAMMAAPDDDHQVVASSVDAIVPPLERAPAPVIEMVVRAPAIRSVLDGPQMRALSLIGSPPARDAFELDLSGRSVARDSSTLEQLVVRPTGRPAFAAPTDIGDLRAALALADVVAEPEAAGPTRAMMSELDLVSPVLASLDDLRNDAARALNTPSSPYVASAPPDVTTGGELMVTTVAETTMDTGSTREQGGALIKRIEPRYPSRARLRGYTDTVQIEFVVTDTGEVGDIVIVSAESKPAFERAVVSAVRNWRYEPLLRDGVAVERTVIETFAFRLGGPDNVVKGVGCRRENNVFMCNTPGLNRIL
ncbi:MAG: energy transducer TonB, partial [Pseudomonadota bacterium]